MRRFILLWNIKQHNYVFIAFGQNMKSYGFIMLCMVKTMSKNIFCHRCWSVWKQLYIIKTPLLMRLEKMSFAWYKSMEPTHYWYVSGANSYFKPAWNPQKYGGHDPPRIEDLPGREQERHCCTRTHNDTNYNYRLSRSPLIIGANKSQTTCLSLSNASATLRTESTDA